MYLFGAVYAAPDKSTTLYTDFQILISSLFLSSIFILVYEVYTGYIVFFPFQ